MTGRKSLNLCSLKYWCIWAEIKSMIKYERLKRYEIDDPKSAMKSSKPNWSAMSPMMGKVNWPVITHWPLQVHQIQIWCISNNLHLFLNDRQMHVTAKQQQMYRACDYWDTVKTFVKVPVIKVQSILPEKQHPHVIAFTIPEIHHINWWEIQRRLHKCWMAGSTVQVYEMIPWLKGLLKLCKISSLLISVCWEAPFSPPLFAKVKCTIFMVREICNRQLQRFCLHLQDCSFPVFNMISFV